MKTRIVILGILVVLASLFGVDASDLVQDDIASPGSSNQEVLHATSEEVRVARVIDGDTIELETGEKVRYIGIDTPETSHPQKDVECFGEEAKAFNKFLVEGKVVRLEKDISETDRYGRLLRYVYIGDVFVNEELVLEGYAYAFTYPPDVKYQEIFAEAQQQARLDYQGLWRECSQ